jgi:hypothetical protein
MSRHVSKDNAMLDFPDFIEIFSSAPTPDELAIGIRLQQVDVTSEKSWAPDCRIARHLQDWST